MKLSILIAALKSRRAMRRELESSLRAQAGEFDDVEILIDEDDGRAPSGEKRNRLMHRARGDYFAFVDDDDRIDDRYVEQLRAGCEKDVDVVSFWVRRTDPTRPTRIHAFSIRYQDRRALSDGKRGMMANHMCAWRRDVGSAVCFPPNLGYNDDVFWYKPLLATGLVRSEEHLHRVLYHYRFHPARTVNERRQTKKATYRWAGKGVECFRRGPELFIAARSVDRIGGREVIPVWDRFGRLRHLERASLERYFLCKAV